MKKKLCVQNILFFMGWFLGVSFAQSPDSIMARSAQWFQSSRGWSLDFSATVQYADSPEIARQQGALLVGEKNRFRLTLPGIIFYSDGADLWQWNREQKQVLIKSVEDLESALHPSELLFKYLNCRATAVKKMVWKGQPVFVLTLDPSQYEKTFTAMEVWLSAGDYSPVRLCTTDTMNNVSWYDIGNLEKKQNIPDREFRFRNPGNVDEVDMR